GGWRLALVDGSGQGRFNPRQVIGEEVLNRRNPVAHPLIGTLSFGCPTEDLGGGSGGHVRNIFEFLSFQIFVKPLWGSRALRSTSARAAVRPNIDFC
ncbi:MAG TPA: hypothetical protein VIK01_00430, partial [Polyangiaceae bacterium]